jgi:integrase/recombinase XerC
MLAGLGDGPLGIRDRAVLLLMVCLTLRRGEVSSLDLEHYDRDRAVLWVKRKRKPERVLIELPDVLVDALDAWVGMRGDDAGPLFWSAPFGQIAAGRRLSGQAVWDVVLRAARTAGVGRVIPTGIRHTAITEVVRRADKKGIRIDEIGDLTGHSKIEVLLRYRDRDRNVQKSLSTMLADAAISSDENSSDLLTAGPARSGVET